MPKIASKATRRKRVSDNLKKFSRKSKRNLTEKTKIKAKSRGASQIEERQRQERGAKIRRGSK